MERKPIAGWPSRTAACLALHGDGLNNRQIADRLRIELSTVSALICSKLKRMGLKDPKEGSLHEFGRRVVISHDILDALALHAARRSLSAEAIVTALLGAIVDDRLVDAVLDDAAELAPAMSARRAA